MRLTALFFIVFILSDGTAVFGQQIPQYSQYATNQYMLNPAAVGVSYYTNIALGGRMQWVGISDAPKTSYIYFSSPFKKAGSSSLNRQFGKVSRNRKAVRHPKMRSSSVRQAYGGNVVADQYGPFRTLKFMGTYAVQIPLSRDYNMSFGTNVGLANRAFLQDKAQVLSVMTNTGQFDQTYNSYTSSQGGQNTLEIDAGLYFWGKGAFAGISAAQLTKDYVKFGNQDINFQPKMHFYFTGGYKGILSNRWTMTGTMLMKYMNPAPISVEGSLLFGYDERFMFGFSYRHKDAVIGVCNFTISEMFEIGYSYDFSISRMMRYTSGGHELVLKLKLGKPSFGSASKI